MELQLYKIAEDIRQLCEGEEWDDMAMDTLTYAFEVKAENIIAIAEKMDNFAAYCKAEEERISAKRKAVENRIASMKRYLQNCMEQAGIMELPMGTKKLALQQNPPKVVIDNEDAIEARFFTIQTTKTLNKKELADHLKRLGDESCPGAHLERGLSLRIR